MHNLTRDQKIFEELNQLRGIDLFTREFFFEKKYAKDRSKVVFFDDVSKERTCISLLIRGGMTNECRERIFSGIFDLGNMKSIPLEKCNYKQLALEILKREPLVGEAKDVFEPIKDGIFRITGKEISEYERSNKSTTLKVVKTLQLMKGRSSRFFQILTPPKIDQKFSLSLRSAFPYEKNPEQVMMISDLEAYLSAEVSEERFQEILITCSSVYKFMTNVIQNVIKILAKSSKVNYSLRQLAFQEVMGVARNFSVQHETKEIALDEELFIHLQKLSFFHFALGYQRLVNIAIPDCQINPVNKQLIDFTNKAFFSPVSEVKEYDPIISVDDVPSVISSWPYEIVGLVERAINISFTVLELDQIVDEVQNVIKNHYYFSEKFWSAFNENEKQVSVLNLIASICAILISKKHVVNFKPYWVGQPSQGGSINSSIESSFLPNSFGLDHLPEEHRLIWKLRVRWIAAALRGQREWIEQQFALESIVVNKVRDIYSSNNTESIVKNLIKFDDLIKESTLKHHQYSSSYHQKFN